MKKIEAIIKPFKLGSVKETLSSLGVQGMIVTEVRGFGRQKGHTEMFRGSEYRVDFVPKIKIEVAVPEEMLDKVIEKLIEATRTDSIGDGKIFVSPAEAYDVDASKWKDFHGTAGKMDPKVTQLELEVVCNISQIVAQAHGLDQSLKMVLDVLSDRLATNSAAITLRHEEDILSVKASGGASPRNNQRWPSGLQEEVTRRIFRSLQPLVVSNVGKRPLFLNDIDPRRIDKGQVSVIGVPIFLDGAPAGALSVDRLFDEDVPLDEDVRFLATLAALVAQLVGLHRRVGAREEDLIKANLALKAELAEKTKSFFSIGAGPAMSEVQDLIRCVAPTEATVMITGESGTGKTLVARIIHELSPRASFPFIKVSCTAMPNELLETELFGYAEDAFTDSIVAKAGRLEEAARGTILLDEIADAPVTLQVKLLQFLQEREFERPGDLRTKTVDVRVIAATDRDLGQAVAEGSFREDLYYTLSMFPVRLPPLRERVEDIVPLIAFFSEKIGRDFKCDLKFTDAAVDVLSKYSWPGNVREVENLIERLAITCNGEIIDCEGLLPYFARDRKGLEASLWQGAGSLREREKRDVVAALAGNGWNLSRAARELGITRRQIGHRVKLFDLEDVVKQHKLRARSASHHRD